MSRAVTLVVEEAVRRHKEMGKSIAVWENGRVVIIPAEEIVLLEDVKTEDALRERQPVISECCEHSILACKQ